MFNHTISAILRGSWLIDKEYADAHMPLVLGMLQGNMSGTEVFKGRSDMAMPVVIGPTGDSKPAYVFNEAGRVVLNDIEPNSVAVIPFIGPMIKYDGACGEAGMVKREAWMRELHGHPGIVGMISTIDTPGGTSDGTPQFARFISGLSKPTAAVIVGHACSAGAWLYSAHDFAFAADKYAAVGSIGAYMTVVDYSGMFEKAGLKVQEIYPEESKDKNISYRKAIEGDTSMVKNVAKDLVLSFREEFAAYRGDRLTSEDWNTGKVFKAEEAVSMGMIDGIMSLYEVAAQMSTGSMLSQVKKVFAQATKDVAATLSNPQNQKSNMKFTNVVALAGVQNVTEAQLALANADLTEAGVTNVTLVTESLISDATAVTAERDQLIATNSTLTSDLATASAARDTAAADLATANARITELEAENARLGAGPGASHESKVGDDTPPENTQDQETQALMDNLSHNRKADSMIG